MSEETSAKLRRRVESLFHEALHKAADRREKFLAEACHDDAAAYREVKSLLSHYEQSAPLDHLPFMAFSGPTFVEGARVGPYEIIRRLGKGGMGEVYLSRDSRLGRKVALKILPQILADNPDLIARLQREAQTASALNHPNILTIYEFGEEGGIQYMACEFVEGTGLRECIGRLSTEEILDYARQIGQALAAAHSVGIVHRDIKPENIMVRSDGYVKVLDFGLAKLTNPQLVNAKSLYERLSKSTVDSVPGLIVGTVNYMSPEQARGQAVDHRTDIWSWGVVLYEMLAGKTPFGGATPSDTIVSILNQDIAPPTRITVINRLVDKALCKSLPGRYQTMADALRDVAGCYSLATQRKKKMIWGTVLLLAALVGAGLYKTVMRFAPVPFHIVNMIRLTTDGNVTRAAISPDGRYVAYITDERNGQTLRIRQVETNSDRTMIASAHGMFDGVTFAKDGQLIYYVLEESGVGKLYQTPLLGGSPRLLLIGIDSPISFSPDGGKFVFRRNDTLHQRSSLIIKNLGDGKETELATVRPPDYFRPVPLWSEDGKSVLCGLFRDSLLGGPKIELIFIRIEDQQQSVIGPEPWYWMGKPVWVNNGRNIAVSATSITSNHPRLLEVSLSDGKIIPISPDTGDYRDLDASLGSKKISTVQVDRLSSIWIVSLHDPAAPLRVTPVGGRFYGVTWRNADSVVSQTDMGGNPDLWSINSRTGDMTQLTNDPFVEETPTATGDGRYLVYASNQDGIFHLWRSLQDGNEPARLTSDTAMEMEASVAPNSQSVIYTSTKSGFESLWKVPIMGGTATRLTEHYARKPVISPDGKLVACEYTEDPAKGWRTAILRSDTGKMVRSLPRLSAEAPVQWAGNMDSLLYIATKNGVSNIWEQPIKGNGPKQLTRFSEGLMFAFAIAANGKVAAVLRGTRTSDVVLLQTVN